MYNLKVVLNVNEEPMFVYINDELAMRKSGWRYDMLDPECSPDWILLIKKYRTFTGKEETFQLVDSSYEKYKVVDDVAPKNFNDFLEGELVECVESEEI
jgi:hypothetical protein